MRIKSYKLFLQLWLAFQLLIYPAIGCLVYWFTYSISWSFTTGYSVPALLIMVAGVYTIRRGTERSRCRAYANLMNFRGNVMTIALWLFIVLLSAATEIKVGFGGIISGVVLFVALREVFNTMIGYYLRRYPADFPED